MSKPQKILKIVWFYSFLLEIFFIIHNIIVMVEGIDFLFSTAFGLEALFINIVIVWGLCFWWLWIPIILYQIIFTIYLIKHKECKELTLKKAIKNKKVIAPLIIAITLIVACFIYNIISERIPLDITKEMQATIENSYQENIYIFNLMGSQDENKEKYMGTITHLNEQTMLEFLSDIDASEDLYKYVYQCYTEGITEFELIISNYITGNIKNIKIKKASYDNKTSDKRTLKLEFDCNMENKEEIKNYLILIPVTEENNNIIDYFYIADNYDIIFKNTK